MWVKPRDERLDGGSGQGRRVVLRHVRVDGVAVAGGAVVELDAGARRHRPLRVGLVGREALGEVRVDRLAVGRGHHQRVVDRARVAEARRVHVRERGVERLVLLGDDAHLQGAALGDGAGVALEGELAGERARRDHAARGRGGVGQKLSAIVGLGHMTPLSWQAQDGSAVHRGLPALGATIATLDVRGRSPEPRRTASSRNIVFQHLTQRSSTPPCARRRHRMRRGAGGATLTMRGDPAPRWRRPRRRRSAAA